MGRFKKWNTKEELKFAKQKANRKYIDKIGKDIHYIQQRDKQLKRQYGITRKQYDSMVMEQDNKCAICNQQETSLDRVALSVDHNHVTKQVRGLLCHKCNVALGLFSESELILIKALSYLRTYNG